MPGKLFVDDLAERFKRSGTVRNLYAKKYRPSNGTEGMMFMERWCDECTKDETYRKHQRDGCPIVAATFAFDTDEEEYPLEWTFDKDGQPCCTAFESANYPTPKPRRGRP